ncbi:DUF3299 domain-containing protein [Alteromonadales bacterium alter-6D02]|nr:DUF3299 domain-containing protein [Alteromonadales bacterium alter-6D02]
MVCCLLVLLLGCGKPNVELNNADSSLTKGTANLKVNADNVEITYQEVDWTELIPKTDLDALLNPPDYITQVVDGSLEDQISSALQNLNQAKSQNESPYEQALLSTNIIEAMDDKHIEIPGFVVPVEFTSEQVIKSFFLVPYFGACLHMPPPPPNQIIFVQAEQDFVLERLYEPVIVFGRLKTELFEDQVATSAYTMKLDSIKMYYETE